MADYIYLLEHRLSTAQQAALRVVREVARAKGMTLFLVGGAVRDLTSGSPVRDLDVVVQGNALKLRKDLEKAGGIFDGEHEGSQALFLRFSAGVRLEVGSTLSLTFPKPGKSVARAANILEDLRRRDFTANAMAISLNEGSYGLLMDPLNGVADIENRQLRLVSNYGFIEDPVRMIRAARLMARLGWTMDEKTQARYDTGKQEGYISVLSEFHRGYETEEIVHEEDPLRVLSRLEAEGWMKVLAPYWGAAKVNVAELERMREAQTQMQMQGIHPDTAAANFPLLVAKLSKTEVASLKAGFPRRDFVRAIDSLEGEAKEFAAQFSGKAASSPSQSWRLLTSSKPEAVLWVAFATKNAGLQAKFKSFYTEWPQSRQKMPYLLMQEMRITPELAGYEDLLEKLFFELMDGRLSTPEEMRAFLEPYSPPAPPPPVNMRRLRPVKKDAKPAKSRAKKAAKADAGEDEDRSEEQDEISVEEDDAAETKVGLEDDDADVDEDADEEAGAEETPMPVVRGEGRSSGSAEAKGKAAASVGAKRSAAGAVERVAATEPAAKGSDTNGSAAKGSDAKASDTNGSAAKGSDAKASAKKSLAAEPHENGKRAVQAAGKADSAGKKHAAPIRSAPEKAVATKAGTGKAVNGGSAGASSAGDKAAVRALMVKGKPEPSAGAPKVAAASAKAAVSAKTPSSAKANGAAAGKAGKGVGQSAGRTSGAAKTAETKGKTTGGKAAAPVTKGAGSIGKKAAPAMKKPVVGRASGRGAAAPAKRTAPASRKPATTAARKPAPALKKASGKGASGLAKGKATAVKKTAVPVKKKMANRR